MDNQRLINHLNQLLSNHFILYVKLHRYHWYIQGRNFFRLHEYFEELYERSSEFLDEVAERILMIGGKPLATMSMYLKQGTLEEANADDTEEEIIAQLIHDFEQVASEIRETGLLLAEEYEDEPTTDMLIEQLSAFEKELWMLRSYQNEK
ncbi:DNA starvation/stationary phase protection protein [Oceanobacillus luteolus]|uniref:Dps family protein n=1 Tax=Oceanobacillus luteolus TaxID=1274358 RepID=UPI00203B7031|nr:DNA starvation/stationary phase protection protein [Oceanobacillus luteolus]MCM3738969.1 DNA starvation/stationary phase protection protein [Oceanobacillus luteolus]